MFSNEKFCDNLSGLPIFYEPIVIRAIIVYITPLTECSTICSETHSFILLTLQVS